MFGRKHGALLEKTRNHHNARRTPSDNTRGAHRIPTAAYVSTRLTRIGCPELLTAFSCKEEFLESVEGVGKRPRTNPSILRRDAIFLSTQFTGFPAQQQLSSCAFVRMQTKRQRISHCLFEAGSRGMKQEPMALAFECVPMLRFLVPKDFDVEITREMRVI